MEAADVIAIVAASISGASAVFTALAWKTSRRSADAAENSAGESRRSADAAERSAAASERGVALTEIDQSTQRGLRENADLATARMVTAQFFGGKEAVWVRIINESSLAISHVELEDVAVLSHSEWHWRRSNLIPRQESDWDRLRPQEEARCHVEWVDLERVIRHYTGADVVIRFSFTDSSGQRWRREGTQDPVRSSLE